MSLLTLHVSFLRHEDITFFIVSLSFLAANIFYVHRTKVNTLPKTCHTYACTMTYAHKKMRFYFIKEEMQDREQERKMKLDLGCV
jgi:hypothetical protein